MRIAQITPSSGDSFYCENCLRDVALVRAIGKLGHDVVMVPLYLPVRSDGGESVSDVPIFFGGVNVYLQQKLALFRKTPRWVDRIFDSPKLLAWVGRRAGMTSARDLGEATLSMLRGEDGRQVKELDRLIEWLNSRENRPDIVCLSNVLLVGLVRRIKERLGVPVVCLLQDEDGFVDALGEPYSQQAWDMLARRSRDVDGFVAVSKYYAGVMQQRLGLAAEKLHVVYIGVSLDGYQPRQSSPKAPTIGFLSRMCFHRGLDTLVEAFIILKKNKNLKNVRLRVSGGSSANDEAFIGRIRERLSRCGVIDDVEFLADFDRDARIVFLRGLTVLSVPEKQGVAYGLYVLEALAAGVPVVEPAFGVFPELLEMTGGGVMFEPNSAESLASAMEPLLADDGYALRLGQQGRKKVFETFNIDSTADRMVRVYRQIMGHDL